MTLETAVLLLALAVAGIVLTHAAPSHAVLDKKL